MTGKRLRKLIQQLLLTCYMLKNEYIYPPHISKHNLNILLMMPNGEGWHYLAVEKLICIIKRNNIKKCRFLLFKLSSFIENKKKT